MKIIPIGKNILLKPIKEQGVLLEVNCEYSEVIAIGNEVSKIKVGQIIGYEADYGVNNLEVNKEWLYFIAEDSPFLLCILEDI
jgi:hypothetical protein